MVRRLVLAASLFLLAACGGGDGRAVFVESRIPPALSPRFWPPEGWAWGVIAVGEAPAQRYGVSSTAGAPAANILILAGYGESAEAWFETARDLNARGYGVWVLERTGQGGSARHVLPRDLGHAPDFEGDIAAVKALARMIRQASPETPLVVLGHSVGGLVALAAAEGGLPADSLILSAPAFAEGAAPSWLVKAGLGRLPARWGEGWTREGPDGRAQGLTTDRWRGAVVRAWQTANPDLRMGGQSLGWRAAFAETSEAIGPGLKGIETPTLLLSAGDDRHADAAAQARVCKAMARCRLHPLAGARHALHLERDAIRSPWLAAVDAFVRGRIAARAADHGL